MGPRRGSPAGPPGTGRGLRPAPPPPGACRPPCRPVPHQRLARHWRTPPGVPHRIRHPDGPPHGAHRPRRRARPALLPPRHPGRVPHHQPGHRLRVRMPGRQRCPPASPVRRMPGRPLRRPRHRRHARPTAGRGRRRGRPTAEGHGMTVVDDLPWTGWALHKAAAVELAEFLHRRNPRTVVEAGSGLSTVVLADYAAMTGAHVVSLEHDEVHAKQTRSLLAERGLDAHADVRLAPLAELDTPAGALPWYGTALPDGIDFALIDGPPG